MKVKHGDKFSGYYNDKFMEGRISISKYLHTNDPTKNIYICQNVLRGQPCSEIFEYQHSYYLANSENIKDLYTYLSKKIKGFKIISDRKTRINELNL